MPRCRLVLALIVCAFAHGPPPARAADPLPTSDELHRLFDEAKYPLVLQKLQRVLVLKGTAAKPYDRYDLLRLKGETHLRMKAQQPAVQAFTDAAAETTDAASAAAARATALLVKRSQNLAYAPKRKDKGKSPDPIPVVEPESRKLALAALFEDEFVAAEPRVKAVADASQLAPILAVMAAVRDVRTLELAAAGTDEHTKKLVGDLGGHARDLMADGLKGLTKITDEAEKAANEIVRVEQLSVDPNRGVGRSEPKWKKRGLARNDIQQLQDVRATCERIAAACRDLAEAVGEASADFAAVRADAGKLYRRADGILTADYKREYDRPPK